MNFLSSIWSSSAKKSTISTETQTNENTTLSSESVPKTSSGDDSFKSQKQMEHHQRYQSEFQYPKTETNSFTSQKQREQMKKY